jgi:drug/metabolite transporter (DMT)-like permease
VRNNYAAMLAVILLASLAAIADYFFKLSSDNLRPFQTWQFYAGIFLYAATGIGTVYIFRFVKLAVFGLTYALTDVLLLTLIGTYVFREPLSLSEKIGIGLGFAALLLLSRVK